VALWIPRRYGEDTSLFLTRYLEEQMESREHQRQSPNNTKAEQEKRRAQDSEERRKSAPRQMTPTESHRRLHRRVAID